MTKRIKVVQEEIFIISANHITPCLDFIRGNIEIFYKLSEFITDLGTHQGQAKTGCNMAIILSDVFYSLAMVSSKEKWTFPELGETIDIGLGAETL